jgi:hypothetical protein
MNSARMILRRKIGNPEEEVQKIKEVMQELEKTERINNDVYFTLASLVDEAGKANKP